MKEQFKDMVEKLHTLINVSVGNDTPRQKPRTTPAKAAMMSLIVSFCFLIIPLHARIEKKNVIYIRYNAKFIAFLLLGRTIYAMKMYPSHTLLWEFP